MSLTIEKGENYQLIVVNEKQLSPEKILQLSTEVENLLNQHYNNIIINLNNCLISEKDTDVANFFIKFTESCRKHAGTPVIILNDDNIIFNIKTKIKDIEIIITKTLSEAIDIIILEEIEKEITNTLD